MYGVQTFRDVHAPDGEERDVLHIAFHVSACLFRPNQYHSDLWQDFHHYSSVRHSEGPHTGMPDVTKDRLQTRDRMTSAPVVEVATPWKISAIQEGLGGKYDRATIIEMLQQCRGNIDRAFCNLLGEESSLPPPLPSGASASTSGRASLKKSKFHLSSRSSSPFSTASKRSADDADADNDDDSDSEEEDPQPAQRRRHRRRARAHTREHKRRILPDVTVGIAFRDDQNDLVSLRLRVSPDAVASQSGSGSGSGSGSSGADDERQDADSGVGLEQDKHVATATATATATASPSQSSSQTESGTKLRRSRRLTRGVPPQSSQ